MFHEVCYYVNANALLTDILICYSLFSISIYIIADLMKHSTMSFWKDSQTLDLYAEELFDQDSVIVEPQSAQILIFTLQQRLFVVNCTMECTICNTSCIQLLEYELNSYLIQVLTIVFLSLKTLESRQYLFNEL